MPFVLTASTPCLYSFQPKPLNLFRNFILYDTQPNEPINILSEKHVNIYD
jgi:hypothetical protein